MAYSGAYGKRGRPGPAARPAPVQAPGRPRTEKPPQEQDRLSGAVGALLKKIESIHMETDDLILALILYLMYRESGDKDLLIMLGAMLLT